MEVNSIKNKNMFYELYSRGAFGNHAISWNSYEDFISSGWKGKVSIRSKTGIDRKKVKYLVKAENVEETIKEFESEGFSKKSLTFNQSMPDEHLLIQGEVMRNTKGLNLTYTTLNKPMNIALKEKEIVVEGIKAKFLLQSALWPNSYDDLMELLETFRNGDSEPSCVVEFSAYDITVGNIPSRNTVFWEVRNY